MHKQFGKLGKLFQKQLVFVLKYVGKNPDDFVTIFLRLQFRPKKKQQQISPQVWQRQPKLNATIFSLQIKYFGENNFLFGVCRPIIKHSFQESLNCGFFRSFSGACTTRFSMKDPGQMFTPRIQRQRIPDPCVSIFWGCVGCRASRLGAAAVRARGHAEVHQPAPLGVPLAPAHGAPSLPVLPSYIAFVVIVSRRCRIFSVL